jgi:hypothetical protein
VSYGTYFFLGPNIITICRPSMSGFRGIRRQIVLYSAQQFATDFLVGHFTAAEAHRDLGLVAFLQEADQVAHLHLIVALFSAGAKLHFLDLDLLLLALRCVRLLVLFEQEFAKVHDATDRWLRRGRHLHQIEFGSLRHLQRFKAADDADLLARSINHPQLGRGDFFVAPDALSYGSSDALYLQNSPAAARDLFGKLLSNDLNGHCSEILAITRAHGQRIRTCFAVAGYQ